MKTKTSTQGANAERTAVLAYVPNPNGPEKVMPAGGLYEAVQMPLYNSARR